jgi:hypothetical protein
MKYLFIIFFWVSKIPLFAQNCDVLHRQESRVTYQCQFDKIDINNKIRSALREIREQGIHCLPYMKDSIFYTVSVSTNKNSYFLFVRPCYYFEAPDLRAYDIFGVITINKTFFLFYGLNDKLLFNKSKIGKRVNCLKFTTDTSLPLIPIFCDGCSQTWLRNVQGKDVIIEAEICKVNAKPLH